MIEFICVGLDIRVWPTTSGVSADATVWSQSESLYKSAQSDIGLKENYLQLLQVETPMELERLQKLVDQVTGATLVAFDIPLPVFNACQQVGQRLTPTQLNKNKWENLFYDVCDINGFFSIYHMNILNDKEIHATTNGLTDALVLSQAANILVPAHRPFVVVKLKIPGHMK